jgi:hypothetical protein
VIAFSSVITWHSLSAVWVCAVGRTVITWQPAAKASSVRPRGDSGRWMVVAELSEAVLLVCSVGISSLSDAAFRVIGFDARKGTVPLLLSQQLLLSNSLLAFRVKGVQRAAHI